MKDELKKYVDQNREAFEVYDADFDKMWEGVASKLDGGRRSMGLTWVMHIAASILILVSITFAYQVGKRTVAVKNTGLALHNVSPEMAETEAFYKGQIDEKLLLISNRELSETENVYEALHQLDKDYEDLRKDLMENTDTEEVVDAMISYYRLKLQLLEEILNEMKNKEGLQHEEIQL